MKFSFLAIIFELIGFLWEDQAETRGDGACNFSFTGALVGFKLFFCHTFCEPKNLSNQGVKTLVIYDDNIHISIKPCKTQMFPIIQKKYIKTLFTL